MLLWDVAITYHRTYILLWFQNHRVSPSSSSSSKLPEMWFGTGTTTLAKLLIFLKISLKKSIVGDQNLKIPKGAPPYFKIYFILIATEKEAAKNNNIYPSLKTHEVGFFGQFSDQNWSWGRGKYQYFFIKFWESHF